MPKRIEGLTNEQILQAKSAEKEYTLFDGGGLYLLITPTGSKLWRMKYRFEGKEKSLSFGAYPVVTLADARLQKTNAKDLIKVGVNPITARKEQITAEKELRNIFVSNPRICVCMDGIVEIWKGRDVVRLSKDEAIFVKEQLHLLT